MSDEDERQLHSTSHRPSNDRRLLTIKSKLQELTREKTKYNVEKLKQDGEFLRSEIDQLRQAIRDLNDHINTQTRTKRTLNAEMTNFKSHAGLSYSSLEIALRDKECFERELKKPFKTPEYRNLAGQKIRLINSETPQLQRLEEYKARLKAAEEAQETARKRREIFEGNLNKKIQKRTEVNQLLMDSEIRLPQIEQTIEELRAERQSISSSIGGKKPRQRRVEILQEKLLHSPDSSTKSLEQTTLEFEQRNCQEQLEKLVKLRQYFLQKMSEHQITTEENCPSTPTEELTSPLYRPIVPLEENPTIAMRLPRNFAPLDFQSTTTTEILHSPHYPDPTIEYKKELPSDILDKYAGVTKKNKQQTPTNNSQASTFFSGKKNKKHRKNLAIKHPSQMVYLYNEMRSFSDSLPTMPMFEYDLYPTVKALELIEQSLQSYLNDLNNRFSHQCVLINSARDELENESIRDSALDTFSETSSLIEPLNSTTTTKDLSIVRPEQHSSSSSDDKKTIVSSSSPASSHHSHSNVPLTTVEESSSTLCPLTCQLVQIERQTSDEGYRSVQNERQRSTQIDRPTPILIRSTSYDSAEKVDLWLANSTPINTTPRQDSTKFDDFQATNNDE